MSSGENRQQGKDEVTSSVKRKNDTEKDPLHAGLKSSPIDANQGQLLVEEQKNRKNDRQDQISQIQQPDQSNLGNLDQGGQQVSKNVVFEKKNNGAWTPYENSKYEMEFFRFIPRGYYRVRAKIQSFLHVRLFRLFNMEITLGGLIFMLLLIGLTAGIGYLTLKPGNSAKTSGAFASIISAVLFAFSGRNSIWIFFTGISYERIIIWHKLIGFLVIAIAIPHGVFAGDKDDTISGIVLTSLFGATIVVSFLLKLFSYRLFLVFHRLMIVAVIILLAIHDAGLAFIGVGIWGVDLLIRFIFYFINRSTVQSISAAMKSATVVELSFPKKNFNYQAGQYVFVTLPQISIWEPHPFSISSSPHDEKVVLHVKILGAWTKKLAKLAGEGIAEMSIYVDGPYGNPSVDAEDDSIDTFLFISGGIGVTPMRSIANCLLNQASRGRKIRKLVFCWGVRNLEKIRAVMNKSEWLSCYNKFNQNDEKIDVVDMRVHFTKIDPSSQNLQLSEPTPFLSEIINKKLDLVEEFNRLSAFLKTHSSGRVAVMACGPSAMLNQASSLARKFGYQFHGEVFEL
jgi:predicted ferric reductase